MTPCHWAELQKLKVARTCIVQRFPFGLFGWKILSLQLFAIIGTTAMHCITRESLITAWKLFQQSSPRGGEP